MNDKLPQLNREEGVKLSALMELFYQLFKTHCEYINDSPKDKRIPTKKYMEFVLYAIGERIKEEK